MALRKIRVEGDEILRKTSKEVKEITPRIKELIEDMKETMVAEEGAGLAAPQVGVLKRIVMIDVGDGPIVLVNPVITEQSGEQVGPEGCLSVPGKSGIVTRPNELVVTGYDEEGEAVEYEGSELFARAICHEVDHLNGKLYIDIAKDLKVLIKEEN